MPLAVVKAADAPAPFGMQQIYEGLHGLRVGEWGGGGSHEDSSIDSPVKEPFIIAIAGKAPSRSWVLRKCNEIWKRSKTRLMNLTEWSLKLRFFFLSQFFTKFSFNFFVKELHCL